MLDNTTLLFIDVDDETNTFVFTPVHIELIHQYDDGLSKLHLTDVDGDGVEVYQDTEGRLSSALGWKIIDLKAEHHLMTTEERAEVLEAFIHIQAKTEV